MTADLGSPIRLLPDLRVLGGLAGFSALLLFSLGSLFWTPHGSALSVPLAAADAAHWLGTDAMGRDVVSVLMSASLATLLLAGFATLIGLFIGVPVGAAAALGEGEAPRPPPALAAIVPAFVIGMIASALGAHGNLTLLVAAVLPGAVWTAMATSSAVSPLWRSDFNTAARLAGLSPLMSAQRHVLPRLLPQLAAIALEALAAALLVELSLSFAGLGVIAPNASLGLMLREGREFLAVRPLLMVAPGVVALGAVLALVTSAGGLREDADAAR